MSVVAAKLSLFQAQIEGMDRYPLELDPLELGQTELGKSPERLNAVAVACPTDKFVFSVVGPELPSIAPIDQPGALSSHRCS